MPNTSYFGIKLGEAVQGGLGHIASALQRRYELERENELRNEDIARQDERQLKNEQLAFAQQGVALPSQPKAVNFGPLGPSQPMRGYSEETLSPLIAAHQRKIALDEDMRRAQIGAISNKNAGGLGTEKLKIGGRDVEIPVRYDNSGNPIPFSLPAGQQQKPLNQFQANAAQGVMMAKKLSSMVESAGGKPIGRFGGLGGTLSQRNPIGKAIRMGDPTAQDFASTKDELVDLIARIRTGAVITSNEEKIYANKIYSILQDEGVNLKNIKMMEDYFKRALPKGYNPETGSYEDTAHPVMDFTPEEVDIYERMIAEGK